MTEADYKDVCDQIKYHEQKTNNLIAEYDTKIKGCRVTLDALIKVKEQYEEQR